ncbi:hypothetical protein [Vibrio campbellii]|uniref:hypothetical protein n=2 Tax=Vibrio campbellii TaxID=680 RepID=UPI0006811F28|nr:hypothetical protein [Vibrio campbellii]
MCDVQENHPIVNENLKNKLLGKVCETIGQDLDSLYKVGRDKIIEKATKKVKDIDDNRQANLRVARDVFTNGSYSDSEICAEYFGGALASSRSEGGQDDEAVNYLNTIKILSSKQLHLHYIIYNALNRLFSSYKEKVNFTYESELRHKEVVFTYHELEVTLGMDVHRNLTILYKEGLISSWEAINNNVDSHVKISPTLTGILLYCVAHNELNSWKRFNTKHFGNFENLSTPKYCNDSLDAHKKMLQQLLNQ